MHPISVCIIAKNEEKRIEKCLSSIKPYGFEIVVVDTGSTDRTKELASKYADQVLDFEWCDDFSAARNFSLRAAKNNWIFMIDCDEWIKTIDVEELTYFRKHLSDCAGSVSRENIVTENGNQVINNTDNTERFFDRRHYHYTGMIHEQLTPIHGTEIKAYLLQTTLLHTGYDMTPEERDAKYERNISLLQKQLEQEPDNPYLYYQLGKSCEIIADYARACEYYSKGLFFDLDPELAYVQAMVVSYGNALLYTGQNETALSFEGIYDAFSSSADFVYLMGNIYKQNEMYEKALEQYQKAMGMPLCKQNGANSYLPLYRVGEICEILGDITSAIACYKQCSNLDQARERLEILLRQNS
ncbi:MAG: glycosyltransferase [Lachnospiraceae bacterium]|nr:glycosyltransferase [Lachnospiraceae bacterium]